jgi:hypothetical protein
MTTLEDIHHFLHRSPAYPISVSKIGMRYQSTFVAVPSKLPAYVDGDTSLVQYIMELVPENVGGHPSFLVEFVLTYNRHRQRWMS